MSRQVRVRPLRDIVLAVVSLLFIVCFFHVFHRPTRPTTDIEEELSFTEFLSKVEQKRIREVRTGLNWYWGVYEDTHKRFRTYGPTADTAMVQKLRDLGVEVRGEPEGR